MLYSVMSTEINTTNTKKNTSYDVVKRWREDNPRKLSEQKKRYRLKNQEKIKQYYKHWYLKKKLSNQETES